MAGSRSAVRRMIVAMGIAILGAVVASACVTLAAAPRVHEVDALDFSFTFPETITAGWSTFRMTNRGEEPHHAQFIKLNEGVTVDEFLAVLDEGPQAALELASAPGGIGVAEPGGTSEVTVLLEAGEYVALCFIPSEDGIPHLAKGMVTPFTVAPPEPGAPVARAPAAAATITMHDYHFEQPQTLPAGRNVFRIVNEGQDVHEWLLIRVREGTTMEEVLEALAEEDETAPEPDFIEDFGVGGADAMTHGMTSYVTLDLAPGQYLALCFLPDEQGVPHAALGMVEMFTVQ